MTMPAGTGARSSSGGSADINWPATNVFDGATSGFWSFWLRLLDFTNSYEGYWFKDDYPTQAAGWGFQRQNGFASIGFFERGGAGPLYTVNGGVSTPTGWMHFAAYHDATLVKTYLNGVASGSGGTAGNALGNAVSAMGVGVPGTEMGVSELSMFRDLSRGQADSIAANLAALQSPMAQAVTPAFYCRLDSATTTETDLVGGLTATVPGNSIRVAGPGVAAPPSLTPTPAGGPSAVLALF